MSRSDSSVAPAAHTGHAPAVATTSPGEAAETLPPAAADALILPADELRLESHLVDEGTIGEGGMAMVHRVFDRRLGRRLAMKVLKPGCSENGRKRFMQEVHVTALLEHPAIVPVHCAGMDARGQPSCFTMKLVEGQTLEEIFGALEAPLRGRALADLLRDMLKVCDAIAFAHSRGVIHCDLKPSNLMFGRFGEAYVMDWGIALVREPILQSLPEELREVTRGICGTPSYMAPEQARGHTQRIDERSDIYALGAILYEALTLFCPHAGGSTDEVLMEAAWANVEPPDQVCCDDPPPAELSDIVMQALAPDPDERFMSVEELSMALERFLDTGAWFARRRFRRSELIVREGERGECAYLVESGRCDIYTESPSGRTQLRSIGPGEMFGELALFAADSRVATVAAATDVVLLEISSHAVDLELPPGSWSRHMVDTLGRRFLEYDRERRKR